MKRITVQDYFKDALHYRAHDDMPGAVLPELITKSFFAEGLFFEETGNACMLGVPYEFPYDKTRIQFLSKGDAIATTRHISGDGTPLHRERFMISKDIFEKNYSFDGQSYRLKPFQKKLATEDFLLLSNDKKQADFIAKDSDLIWRGGEDVEYERFPALPGFSVPIMHGKTLFEGLNAAYNKAGAFRKMPTLYTDAGIRIRYDSDGIQRNPYDELSVLFTHAQACIKRDAHMLRLPIEFVSALDAHKNDFAARARMFRRKRAQFSVVTEQARNDLG